MYALTVAINPMVALDIGTRWGAMALQIATGDKDADKPIGRIITVDNEKWIQGSKQPVGKFIPEHLGVEVVTLDAVEYLDKYAKLYDLIFEDTAHTFEMTKAVYTLAIDRLAEGGVIISHDAVHPKFKGAVVNGIKACGIEPEVYLVEGDSCGLAIWQKPKKDTTVKMHTASSYKWDVGDGEIVDGEITQPDILEVDHFIAENEREIEKEIEETPSPLHIDNPPKRKRRKSTKRKVEKETSL